jgi:hypothetical protein
LVFRDHLPETHSGNYFGVGQVLGNLANGPLAGRWREVRLRLANVLEGVGKHGWPAAETVDKIAELAHG